MEAQVPADDGVICRERIRPRKMKSQNIVHRIRNREHFGNKTSVAHNSFYQCVFPNLTVNPPVSNFATLIAYPTHH